jgi:hypothetical protein
MAAADPAGIRSGQSMEPPSRGRPDAPPPRGGPTDSHPATADPWAPGPHTRTGAADRHGFRTPTDAGRAATNAVASAAASGRRCRRRLEPPARRTHRRLKRAPCAVRPEWIPVTESRLRPHGSATQGDGRSMTTSVRPPVACRLRAIDLPPRGSLQLRRSHRIWADAEASGHHDRRRRQTGH